MNPSGLIVFALLLLTGPALSVASTIKLQWDAPTLNADGTPLTDLAGYRLTFCAGGTCDPNVGGTDITPDLGLVTTYLHTGRTPGTDYRYTIRAKDTGGTLSAFSYQAEARAPLGDLLAWWFRQESGSTTTATDGGWFGFNGTLCEAATCPQQGPTWVTGRVGNAVHCDGVNDNVEVSSNALLDDTGDLSIAFWLNLLSTTHLATSAAIIGKEQPTSPFSTPYMLELFDATLRHLRWYQYPNGPDIALEFSYTVPLVTWVHLVVVRQGLNVTLFVNGVNTQTLSYTSGTPLASGVPIRICTDGGRTSTRYANIDLDEVRLYDYALTQTQITQLAIAPAAPTGIQLR